MSISVEFSKVDGETSQLTHLCLSVFVIRRLHSKYADV